jgi:hypothetical protein
MKDFVFEERVKKLEELNKDERIKMLWMWCKQNVITLNQFKQLISYCCNEVLPCVSSNNLAHNQH